MVTVTLIETGETFDILNDDITYIKQNGDLAKITDINNSYSWGFKFPKTPNNTKILQGLGLVGDTSRIPYEKTLCRLIDNGIGIVKQGMLIVKQTGFDYKIHIKEGIIEFLKEIAVDKIGETVDLSDILHTNDVGTIISSQTRDDYRYLVANYNYSNLPPFNDTENLDPVGLVPWINIKYLFDKIFDHYGWTYEGNFDISNDWMSYPNSIVISDNEFINVFVSDNSVQVVYTGSPSIPLNALFPVDLTCNISPCSIDFDFFEYNSDYVIRVKNASVFYFELKCIAVLDSSRSGERAIFPIIYINGIPVDNNDVVFDSFVNIPGNEITGRLTKTLSQGDLISISYEVFTTGLNRALLLTLISAKLTIRTSALTNIDFNKVLIKYKVKDFLKEIMLRNSLTSFPNVENKHINFKTLDERIYADTVDWSDKYVRRVSESYLYENYAINNYIKQKYNEEGQDYDDGNLIVENENLKEENTLFQSKTYAPLEELYEFKFPTTSVYASIFKMYEVEPEEDDNSNIVLKYTALKERFYFARSVQSGRDIYVLNQLMTNYQIADPSGMSWKDIVKSKYGDLEKILQDTRVHNIELALSKADIATLQLEKKYYFKQEANYYILNKLKYVSGKTSIGEFIRVKNL